MRIWQKKIKKKIFPRTLRGIFSFIIMKRKFVDDFSLRKRKEDSWITKHNMIKSTAIVTLS